MADLSEAGLNEFIEKFSPEHQTLIRAVRAALRARLPSANELVWDNYNFFVIGYCTTLKPSSCIVSLAAAANGVGISFYNGSKISDPKGILQGQGSQNRFLRMPDAQVLLQPEVEALIAQAVALAPPPSDTDGPRLILRSISDKQRPRRAGP